MEKEKKPFSVTVKRILAGLCAAAVLYALLSMVASTVIFSVLFGRAETRDPADLLPEDLEVEWKEVSFDSGGVRLYGLLLYPEGEADGAVILAPGMNSGAALHLAEAQAFARAGYLAMTYDPTGAGKSEGHGVKGLSQGKADLLAAAAFFRNLPGCADLPLALYGHSAGGYAAAVAADEAEGVACVVAAAAFDCPTDLMRETARGYVAFLADLEYPFLCLQNRFVFGGDGDESAHLALASSGVPSLIVATREDSRVPEDLSLARFTDEIPDCTRLSAPRGGHSLFWFSDSALALRDLSADGERNVSPEERKAANELNEAYFEKILKFLSKNLKTNRE